MLKPTPMTLVRMTGLKSGQKQAIDILYELKIIHLVDFEKNTSGREFLGIGEPFGEAKELSGLLVKANSVVSYYSLKGAAKETKDFFGAKKMFEKICLENLKQKNPAFKKGFQNQWQKSELAADTLKAFQALKSFPAPQKNLSGRHWKCFQFLLSL